MNREMSVWVDERRSEWVEWEREKCPYHKFHIISPLNRNCVYMEYAKEAQEEEEQQYHQQAKDSC